MKLKKTVRQLHLWLGLLVGLIFSVSAITGAFLAFEEELEPVVYPQLHFCPAPPPRAERLPLDTLFHRAQQHLGKIGIHQVNIRDQETNRTYIFRSEGGRLDQYTIALNPYTGNVQFVIQGKKHFFAVTEDLHRNLLMGEIGKSISGAACLSYIIILITGLILWWPKNLKMLKKRLKIKWDAKFKRLNWDAHAVGGFYSFPLVLLMVITALTWSYTWFNDGIFYVMDGKPREKFTTNFGLPNAAGVDLPVEKSYQEALRLMPYEGQINISLPTGDADAVYVSREIANAPIPNMVDYHLFNRYTGELVHTELYTDQTNGMKLRRMMFPLHTGNIGGLTTKLIYTIICLYAASLPFTGLWVWLGRKRKK